MKSLLNKSEGIENKKHRFGQGELYFPCVIRRRAGDEVRALFTRDQINEAILRASSNPEDWPEEVTK